MVVANVLLQHEPFCIATFAMWANIICQSQLAIILLEQIDVQQLYNI